ncbi:MAG TPA: FecR domain-containing protein [Steroidobacteraceae bacterium]|nr:FecR domain-containing protein [Steroidobacteraceae bacterium]
MSKQYDSTPADDESIESLLRQVGARDEPAAAVMHQVQQAVHAEWRGMLAERSQQRRRFAYALAASIAIVVTVAAATLQWLAPNQDPIATIARIDGSSAMSVGHRVAPGETLQTDAATRMALAFDNGLSVRIDTGSTVEVEAPDELVLKTGGVYVDSAPGSARDTALGIQTRAGLVTHLGTQYQVRQDARAVVISIREGRVQIEGSQGASHGSAGEVLSIRDGGAIQRSSIAPHDASWRWAITAAPSFAIDNRPLSDFVEWVGRETGKRIAYASPQALQVARGVVLRGSIGELDPESALTAVLSTTELRRFATQDDSIGLELAPPAEPR